MSNNGDYLGVPALARLMGLDRSTVYRQVASGKLKPTMRAGGQALFSPTAVAKILASRQPPASGEGHADPHLREA